LASLSSWPSNHTAPPQWDVPELPKLPDNFEIEKWEDVKKGTHGTIRKAWVTWGELSGCICFKLFKDKWREEYEMEVAAYEAMKFRGVEKCIPEVYFKGSFPASRWAGIKSHETGERILHGLVMEFFEDCYEIEFSKLTVPMAVEVARALRNIHKAHVYQGDMQERNILIVRESGKVRPVWIDFSCAWVEAYTSKLDNDYWSLVVGTMLGKMVDPDHLLLKAIAGYWFLDSRGIL